MCNNHDDGNKVQHQLVESDGTPEQGSWLSRREFIHTSATVSAGLLFPVQHRYWRQWARQNQLA